MNQIIIYCDGAASGNPGPAGVGGVLLKDGVEVDFFSESIGEATNNVAEYRALITALSKAYALGADSVLVHSDSELMVKQIKGEYTVKNEGLAPLYREATELLGRFGSYEISHVRREENSRADDLAKNACQGCVPEKRPNRITFTSDFGHGDGWTGICRAVMRDINPNVEIIDVAHDLPGFDVRKGAFVLATAVLYVEAAVHMAVVDPGVGGTRQAIALETADGTFLVGPDNGLLLPAADRLGGVAKAVAITNPDYMLPSEWATFNARDVFSPVSAHLAKGVAIEKLGQETDRNGLALAPWSPSRMTSNGLEGEIIDIDRFGTARLNITSDEIRRAGVSAGGSIGFEFGSREERMRFERTFSDVGHGEAVALIDSSGFLAIAVNTGSAQDRFGLSTGVRVTLLNR